MTIQRTPVQAKIFVVSATAGLVVLGLLFFVAIIVIVIKLVLLMLLATNLPPTLRKLPIPCRLTRPNDNKKEENKKEK